MARPLSPIPPRQVVILTGLGFSVVELAAFFGVERTTIYRRFAAELAGPGG